MIPFFFFLFGIIIGSFLNVCITRIPDGISIISPASHCPRCGAPIKPYDNIPVLGWFLLDGKCRNCHLPISPMYPIVEFLTGALFLLTYYEFGLTVPAFKLLFFGCLLIILIVTDFRVRILPDAVNWFGFGLGLAFATRIFPSSFLGSYYQILSVPFPRLSPLFARLLDALLGAALGGLFLWAAATIYRIVRKREGMGMGDVKMMIMVGAFLGVRGAFLTILFGTLLGSIIGFLWIVALYLAGWNKALAQRAARRKMGSERAIRWTIASQFHLPFGTFLGAGAFLTVYALPWALSRVYV